MRKKYLKISKRFFVASLVALITLGVSACGKDEVKETTTNAESESEEPDIVFATAVYDEKKGVVVRVTPGFTGDAKEVFVIKDADGNVVPITDAKVVADTNITFTLGEEMDLYGEYTINYGNVTHSILLPVLYSREEFEDAYTYEGEDLGATWTKDATAFKLWAPTATAVSINFYESGDESADDLISTFDMTADVNGTWKAIKNGNLDGTYYTYSVTVKGSTVEACDPYARATGVNGKRAMVIDLDATNPEGWEADTNPNAGINITDAILYELHIRDLSSDESSGITNTGKFIGLTETGTTTADGISTGLDYLKDLGITHLHILPMYDYGSVDESKLNTPQFNWGYDPVNYNVPEGSYSTDPSDGAVRVKEAKEMVMSLHNAGISVVMDVVYNHVYNAEEFCFNKIVPGYFSRISDYGVYSAGSGCGNDTASERNMVSKYIVDSVVYWANEYHIDGFRFDLAGLIDTDTLNKAIEKVHETHPDVIFYAEGWDMKTDVTKKGYTLATQSNSTLIPEMSFFNDYYRDTLKGGDNSKGYATGNPAGYNAVKNMIKGYVSWSKNPSQTINYASCHDGYTIFDKITSTNSSATMAEKIAMNKLSAAMVMTSQGTPFIMSGEEMLRSKVNADGSFSSNSYKSPDSVNSLKWSTLSDAAYMDVHDYYKGLIAFRKAHAGLRMMTADEVNANLTVMSDTPAKVVACHIKGGANGETSKGLFVIYNGTSSEATVTLPAGNWTIYINEEKAGTTALGTANATVNVAKVSAMVLVQE